LWEAYLATYPLFSEERPPTERFGDSAELADELLELVRNGPKRATAGLVAEFLHDNEPLPRIGSHWIVADGAGVARVVLRSTELRIGRLDSVDARFAWDEGEGDRSREWWLDVHRRFLLRTCLRIGITLDDPADVDGLEVVFERFDVVWPQ
jgi:uncharacterized protein YhfF